MMLANVSIIKMSPFNGFYALRSYNILKERTFFVKCFYQEEDDLSDRRQILEIRCFFVCAKRKYCIYLHTKCFSAAEKCF